MNRGVAGSTPAGRTTPTFLTHYCVIRRDLPRGTLAAQLIHAAGESSPGGLASGTRAVALAVEDEAELLALERQLCTLGLAHVAIREPDPPWDGALMAIGMVPVADRQPLRRALGRVSLLK